MTEQEVEALVARLTRVWEPSGTFVVRLTTKMDCFLAALGDGIRVEYSVSSPPYANRSYWLTDLNELTESGTNLGFISFYAPMDSNVGGKLNLDYEDLNAEIADKGRIHVLQSHWLPFFRRGCWLSGLPLEASAHEKAEWMQGFTREELQAWNLIF